MADTRSDPAQPRRFEKKKSTRRSYPDTGNHSGRPSGVRPSVHNVELRLAGRDSVARGLHLVNVDEPLLPR
jgi:hypothetical protein